MYKVIDCFGIPVYEDTTIQNCTNFVRRNNWKKNHYFIQHPNGKISRIHSQYWKKTITIINRKECVSCGRTENLTYHHVDPTLKKFTISVEYKYYTEEEILEEIEKCVVLCEWCHNYVETGDLVVKHGELP